MGLGVLHPPKNMTCRQIFSRHLACREICSTPVVLVDVATREKPSLSENLV